MTDDALTGLTVREYPERVAARYCGRLLAMHGARAVQAGTPTAFGTGYA